MRARSLLVLAALLVACSNGERRGAPAKTDRPPAALRLSPAEEQRVLQRLLLERFHGIRWSGPHLAGDGWNVADGELAGQPGSVVISTVVGNSMSAVVTSGCPTNECGVYSIANGALTERVLRPETFAIDARPFNALAPSGGHPPCAANENEITALILYTEVTVRARNNDAAALESDIRTAVAAANLSFTASGLTSIKLTPLAIRLLPGFFEDSSGSIDLTLSSFAQDPEVNRLREETGADVVILVAGRADACGKAFQMTSANANTFENSAFAVVRWDCLACHWSLAHELGHLMGACHERSAHDCPVIANAANFGLQDQPPTNSPVPWVTMMATFNGCQTCPRLNQWSNPRLSCSGDATGSATEDNADFLAMTAPLVAKFRCTR